MKRIFCIGLLMFIFIQSSLKSIAQSYKPFLLEIAAFKKADSVHKPPQHAILLVGSSSFRKWNDVDSYFRGYTIINRGFGGSSIPDVTLYVKDIIDPYKAKEIFIYCGDNDLAASDTITPAIVFNRFKILYQKIRAHNPTAKVVFVSIKPSPSRRQLMPAMEASNDLIKRFLSKQKNAAYADVYHPMIDNSHQPLPYIFESDSLHMNSKGYEIWKKVLQPYLIKN